MRFNLYVSVILKIIENIVYKSNFTCLLNFKML